MFSIGATSVTRVPAARSGVPCRGHWDQLSAGQKAVNASHTKVRAAVKQAAVALKTWRLPHKLRSRVQLALFTRSANSASVLPG